MPEMSGCQLVTILQNQPEITSALVIGLTGSVEKDDIEEFRQSGCFAVIEKPLQIHHLEKIIKIHKEREVVK